MKYSIQIFHKIIMFTVFALFTVITPQMIYLIYFHPTLISVCFVLVFIAMLIYLMQNFIAINKENLKTIFVDYENKKFVCTTKHNQILEIAYNDVEYMLITKGHIIRGLILGQISIITKQGKVYKITISNIDCFIMNISKDLTTNLKESLFFKAK